MSKDYPFAQAILDATDGGLRIIKDYYPTADDTKLNKAFKIRDERTPSATLKKLKDGTWIIADWGAWDKPKNGIGVAMYEDNLTFGEACKKLAELYHVVYDGFSHQPRPTIEKRALQKDEKPGEYIFDYKDELTEAELKAIGPNVTDANAIRYHLKSVHSYSYIKKDEVITTVTNDDYPVFVFDFGTWQKIYQPMSADKKYRFRYVGGRPENHIFGLDAVEKAFKKLRKKEEDKYNDDDGSAKLDIKLSEIIICSGDRDAMNVASFGYNVVWLNSESAKLEYKDYKKFNDLADNVYNLPDIDNTGVRQAVQLAMKYLDLKTIWLPEYLKYRKDFRGNSCKDVRDFIHHFYRPVGDKTKFYQFDKLVQNALPMKFWDEIVQYDKDGNYKGVKHNFNIVHSHHFLMHNGFYRYETPNEKEDYCYIHIDGNIVRRTTATKIANYVIKFMKDRQIPVPIRNMVLRTPYLKDATLNKLPIKEIDFVDCDENTQYWFFPDVVLEITKEGIRAHKKGIIDKFIWEEQVIDHKATVRNIIEEAHFKILKDKDGDLNIKILKKDTKFLNYLINASRIHWRKDLEYSFKGKPEKEAIAYFKKHQFDIAAPNLDTDEIYEQKLHLINKIYALGYLLHKHKDKSKAWFVFAMDNKLSEVGESHGGSGKSLFMDNLNKVLTRRFYIPGRNKKATANDFIYDGVTEETDYVFVDDMNQFFDFQFFFSDITASMKINPKNNKQFEIPFAHSPKLCGTSNFPPRDLDPSTSRRVLFNVFSDYYHYNKDGEYKQTRQVSDDFGGKNLFDDFTHDDYNATYNFFAQCLQFYLATPHKIEPPMDNVTKRNLIAEMGDAFKDWADVFFVKLNEDEMRDGLETNLDTFLPRSVAFKSFQAKTKNKMSANRFKKAVTAFCKYKNYLLDPIEYRNADGRILKKMPIDGISKTEEVFYIQTEPNTIEPTQDTKPPENTTSDDSQEDDLPF